MISYNKKKERNIPIFSYCDDNYVPYLAVLVNSIKKNVSKDYIYEVIVAEFDISEENKLIVESMCKETNIKVRFLRIDNETIIEKSLDWKVGKWTRELYISLLAPYILSEYDKIIYMDCDVINLHDLADLYNIDIENNLVGAVRLMGRACMEGSGFLTENVMEFERDDMISQLSDYFNNGTMIVNLKEFRDTYDIDYIFSVIDKRKFALLDQDCFNFLCKGRVKYIQAGWNWYPYTDEEFKNTIKICPDKYKEYFKDGFLHPLNIHYTIPVKPWLEPFGVYGDASTLFWENASTTPFYETIVERMIRFQDWKRIVSLYENKNEREFLDEVRKGELFLYGCGYKGKMYIENHSSNIKGVIDEDKSKWGKYHDVPVMGLSDFEKSYTNRYDVVILISNDNYADIVFKLHLLGYRKLHILKCINHAGFGIESSDYGKILCAQNIFYDDKSKYIFRKIVDKRIAYQQDRNIKCLDIYEGNMYVLSQLFSTRNDRSIAFINPQGITDNLKRKLNKWASEKGIDVSFTEREVYDKNIDCFCYMFSGNDLIEKISTYKDAIRNTSGIMFIDIRGEGKDLWEVPLFIHREFNDYCIFMRHHTAQLKSGTVLSVMPRLN